MRHSEQVAQIKTLMARLDSGTTVDAGGFRVNPTWVYTDPDLAAREQHEFFDSHPQVIGLSADLPEAGSFLSMNDLATPILATRDSDGRFRAFVNSCRHRGMVLEERRRGSARRFVCGFHSWTYDTGGALVGLPKPDHFGDIDLDCRGLIELPAAEKYGLLYVHPQVNGHIDIDELLGEELADELDAWNIGELGYIGEDSYPATCNWKIAMDSFGETYHFTTLHQNTLAREFYGNVQCYDTFGRNHRMLLVRRDIDGLRGLPEDDWEIGKVTLPVYWLFPNVQLMPFAFGCVLLRAYPDRTDPGNHVSRIAYYYWKNKVPESARDDVLYQMTMRFGNVIREEDYVVCASQQVSANSGRLDNVLFGRNEPALHHFHNTYRSVLGMDPLPLLDRVEEPVSV